MKGWAIYVDLPLKWYTHSLASACTVDLNLMICTLYAIELKQKMIMHVNHVIVTYVHTMIHRSYQWYSKRDAFVIHIGR